MADCLWKPFHIKMLLLKPKFIHLFILFKEEERKREQEEQKRKENEMVFKAWLQKKKEQVQEEKRSRRAKELEDLNSKVRSVLMQDWNL